MKPTLFAGREQQFLAVLKKLSHVRKGQHASFILHGERGIGKTALPQLIQIGAVKEDLNSGKLSLHSELFKSAIRFHLKSLEKMKM